MKSLTFRQAVERDINALVHLLADDVLGEIREDVSDPLNQRYRDSFAAITKDLNNELIILEVGGELAGMMQLTFIPYLTHTGSWRCMIEGVRISASYRSAGLGKTLFNWAIERAKQRGCSIVQLTSNKERVDALRFYEALGFRATHEGFKLDL